VVFFFFFFFSISIRGIYSSFTQYKVLHDLRLEFKVSMLLHAYNLSPSFVNNMIHSLSMRISRNSMYSLSHSRSVFENNSPQPKSWTLDSQPCNSNDNSHQLNAVRISSYCRTCSSKFRMIPPLCVFLLLQNARSDSSVLHRRWHINTDHGTSLVLPQREEIEWKKMLNTEKRQREHESSERRTRSRQEANRVFVSVSLYSCH